MSGEDQIYQRALEIITDERRYQSLLRNKM
jgi:hypothetical protein